MNKELKTMYISNEQVQKGVTKLLAHLMMRKSTDPENNGKYKDGVTLSQCGYLGTSVRTDVSEHALFIEPTFAKELNTTKDEGKIILNPKLMNVDGFLIESGTFWDHLFFVDRLVPRYKVVIENSPKLELKKKFENAETIVIQCDPFVVVAALLDINLEDVNISDYTIKAVGERNKPIIDVNTSDKKSERQMTADIEVTYPVTDGHFTPEAATEFIKRRRESAKNDKASKKRDAKKQKEAAKKNPKKMNSREFGI